MCHRSKKSCNSPGRFEATLILDEHTCNLDLDNACKAVIDYARRLGLIVDDETGELVEWLRVEMPASVVRAES